MGPEPHLSMLCLRNPGLTWLREQSPLNKIGIRVPLLTQCGHLCLPALSSEVSILLFSLLRNEFLPVGEKYYIILIGEQLARSKKMKVVPFPPKCRCLHKITSYPLST